MTQPSPTSTTPASPSPSSPCCSSSPLSGSPCCQSVSVPSAPTVSATLVSGQSSKSASNASTPTESASATLRELTIHRDNRGNVRETFRASWFPEVPPIKQLVRSKSKPKTLRGMHLHRRQWDLWHIVSGAALVRLYRHDSGSNNFIWAGPGLTLAIPPGLSHGFYTPDGCVLMYGLTEEYDGTDEFGWFFTDGLSKPPVEFQDEWPTRLEELHISDRDLWARGIAGLEG